MSNYKIRKTLRPEDVRQVCIENNYYTRGDCKAYEEMFSMLDYRSKVSDSNISSGRLYDIAEDIKDHSDTEDTIEDIMSKLVVHITCTLYIK